MRPAGQLVFRDCCCAPARIVDWHTNSHAVSDWHADGHAVEDSYPDSNADEDRYANVDSVSWRCDAVIYANAVAVAKH